MGNENTEVAIYIPIDIVRVMYSFLNGTEVLLKGMRVCREWRYALDVDEFWIERFQREFGNDSRAWTGFSISTPLSKRCWFMSLAIKQKCSFCAALFNFGTSSNEPLMLMCNRCERDMQNEHKWLQGGEILANYSQALFKYGLYKRELDHKRLTIVEKKYVWIEDLKQLVEEKQKMPFFKFLKKKHGLSSSRRYHRQIVERLQKKEATQKDKANSIKSAGLTDKEANHLLNNNWLFHMASTKSVNELKEFNALHEHFKSKVGRCCKKSERDYLLYLAKNSDQPGYYRMLGQALLSEFVNSIVKREFQVDDIDSLPSVTRGKFKRKTECEMEFNRCDIKEMHSTLEEKKRKVEAAITGVIPELRVVFKRETCLYEAFKKFGYNAEMLNLPEIARKFICGEVHRSVEFIVHEYLKSRQVLKMSKYTLDSQPDSKKEALARTSFKLLFDEGDDDDESEFDHHWTKAHEAPLKEKVLNFIVQSLAERPDFVRHIMQKQIVQPIDDDTWEDLEDFDYRMDEDVGVESCIESTPLQDTSDKPYSLRSRTSKRYRFDEDGDEDDGSGDYEESEHGQDVIDDEEDNVRPSKKPTEREQASKSTSRGRKRTRRRMSSSKTSSKRRNKK